MITRSGKQVINSRNKSPLHYLYATIILYSTFYILYAEDDADDQYLFQEMMKRLNVSLPIIFHNNGRSLVNDLQRLRPGDPAPALIVLDLNMPEMDGFAALKWLKASTEFKHLPVLMLSTSTAQTFIDQSIALGAAQYLAKPVTVEEETRLAQRILELWKQHQDDAHL